MSIREDEFVTGTESAARDEITRLLLLVEASGELLGSPRLDAVLPAVLEVAQRILAADAYSLWLRDVESDVWRVELAAGLSDDYQAAATAAVVGAPRTVELTGAFVVEDVDTAVWVTAPHRAAYEREGIRSLLAMPLWMRGEVAGTLVFYYREPRVFPASDRRIAAALSGVAASAIATAELVERQSRAAEERRFVAEASEILASSLDYETTLRNVAQLAVPRVADWCAIDLVGADGSLERLAVAHADPDPLSDVPDERRSTMTVPLTAHDRTLGAITFVRVEPGRRYTEADLQLTEGLARQAALAIENARLLAEAQRSAAELDAVLATAPVGVGFWDSELRCIRSNDALAAISGGPEEGQLAQALREVIETGRPLLDVEFGDARRWLGSYYPVLGAAGDTLGVGAVVSEITERRRLQERLEFLAEASATLASSLDYETTLENVAGLAVPRLADWCAIDLFEEDGIRRVAAAHADPAKAETAELMRTRFAPRPDDPTGPAEVRRTGKPLLVAEVPAEALSDPLLEPERQEMLRSLGMRSVIVVPLLSRGRVLGSLTLVTAESGRRYDEDDLEFAQHVARRTAAAVDNALLYRQGQRALRTAEDSFVLLDALLATAPVGLSFLDTGLRYVRVNAALAEMNGAPIGRHLGRRPDEVVSGLGERIAEHLRRVLETGEPQTDVEIEWVSPGPPPQVRHRLASYYPVRRPDGELIGVGGIALDITERKRSEQALRFLAEASELLAATLDVEQTLRQIASLVVPALAGQCIVDLLEEDGSTRCVAVAHRDPEKLELLREVRRRYPPAAPGHPVQAALRTGESQLLPVLSDEAIAAMAQNEEHREQIRVLGNTSGIVVPLVARGRILGTITLGTLPPQAPYGKEDVALAEELARRAAVAVDNARLYQAAEERAQAAVALAYVGDGVALIDGDGVVRLWNDAATQITGIATDEVVGRRAAEAVPGWGDVAEHVPVESGPSGRAVTLPLELDGRELWLSVSAVGYPDGAVYAFRDLTEERALERMRNEFISTVSHELRTPLAAIYGAALTLQREDVTLALDQRAGLLDVIASESDRLARIVNDILWASRLDSGTVWVTLERCDVAALAAEVVAAARLHLPPRVELGLELASEAAFASCDPDKLRQVLTNLVDNAIKYSPDGGRVGVSVRSGDQVRIAVRDEGLGIPEAEQSRVFEKFYRLDPNLTRGVGGTGLGLYICRELVRVMDGSIWVVSREGAGSTFTVELRT